MPRPAHLAPMVPTDRPSRRPSRAAAMLLAAAVALAGCGGADDTAEEATQTAVATSAPAATEPTPQATTDATTDPTTGAMTTPPSDAVTEPAATATVAVASSDLGDILVGADGMTLYLFDNDTDGASTCTGDCLANWPPLIAQDPVAGDDVDATLATFERADTGEQQVTANGRPLYYWAGDSEPGDVTGHGVGEVWWAVTTAGEAVAADAGTAASAGGSSGDGNLAEGVDDGGY